MPGMSTIGAPEPFSTMVILYFVAGPHPRHLCLRGSRRSALVSSTFHFHNDSVTGHPRHLCLRGSRRSALLLATVCLVSIQFLKVFPVFSVYWIRSSVLRSPHNLRKASRSKSSSCISVSVVWCGS